MTLLYGLCIILYDLGNGITAFQINNMGDKYTIFAINKFLFTHVWIIWILKLLVTISNNHL